MVFVMSDVAGLCPNGFSAPNQINMIAKLKRSSVNDERLSQFISQESNSRTFFINELTIFPRSPRALPTIVFPDSNAQCFNPYTGL